MSIDSNKESNSWQNIVFTSAGGTTHSRFFSFYHDILAHNNTNFNLSTINISNHVSVTAITGLHLACAYKTLDFQIIPGPASYGRVVSLTAAFSHVNATAPTANTVHQLPNSSHFVFGGASDPPLTRPTTTCMFNYGIRHLLKPAPVVGGPPIIYVSTSNQTWGGTQIAGNIVTVRVSGTIEVAGNDIHLQ